MSKIFQQKESERKIKNYRKELKLKGFSKNYIEKTIRNFHYTIPEITEEDVRKILEMELKLLEDERENNLEYVGILDFDREIEKNDVFIGEIGIFIGRSVKMINGVLVKAK